MHQPLDTKSFQLIQLYILFDSVDRFPIRIQWIFICEFTKFFDLWPQFLVNLRVPPVFPPDPSLRDPLLKHLFHSPMDTKCTVHSCERWEMHGMFLLFVRKTVSERLFRLQKMHVDPHRCRNTDYWMFPFRPIYIQSSGLNQHQNIGSSLNDFFATDDCIDGCTRNRLD